MGYPFDPYDPRRRPRSRPATGTGQPTVEDFRRLAQSYQELQETLRNVQSQQQALEKRAAAAEQERNALTRSLKETRAELEIKNEALHRQSADLKELESELVWAKAALRKQEAEEEEENSATWQEKYQRLQAELENLRKRLEKRADQEVTDARHRILLDMLPLADHLDLALQHADSLTDPAAWTFLENIQATRQAFLESLRRYGVTRIPDVNSPFDPAVHEAVGQVDQAGIPADHVAEVLQAGYMEGDRVIRPARVLISSDSGGAAE